MENDWDLTSIVRSCKATTFTNSSTFGETSPQNLSTTNSITSPINATPSCFEDFIFNQENSPIAYTHTMKNNWDLSSIVCRCKVTSFTNPSTFCETPPQNLTTINSIISPINTSPSCFEDFIFNQESSLIANTHTLENDWDLFSIVRRWKVTTFTNPPTICETPPQNLATMVTTTTTNSLVFPINVTPSCFVDFTSNQENSSGSFISHKPNDFTDLNKLRINFNSNTHIPTPTTISTPTITHAHRQQPKRQSRKRKNKNNVTSVCHVKEDKLSEDKWRWKKYGRNPIKGSPHLRSYYKCSSFKDCPARKQVEKSETEENTYVVTYRGKHNHPKPEVKQNSDNGTSQNKSSKARLPIVGQAESSQNFENLGYPNVVMIPNMSAMVEDFLPDINFLNGGSIMV
ncbi:DNA binding domain, variant 2 [Trifolium repens]|nr:DNA binding domain, variant 2 [Trifolium repens]